MDSAHIVDMCTHVCKMRTWVGIVRMCAYVCNGYMCIQVFAVDAHGLLMCRSWVRCFAYIHHMYFVYVVLWLAGAGCNWLKE